MTSNRFFLDTAFVVALLNPRDSLHARAVSLLEEISKAKEVWTTAPVLVEIGNALSASLRGEAQKFIERCFSTPNIQVVFVSEEIFKKALRFYGQYQDKEWGLTDCISFIVMKDHQLFDALTHDIHFQQAGFRAVLRESEF